MNFRQFSGLTAADACLARMALFWASVFFSFLSFPHAAAFADTGSSIAVVPKVVAVSEQFEAVGRLEAEGLVWFIDRADSNAPVLNATLSVEVDGRSADALFRPERGDYLIADAAWLAPLRRDGEHALALTLIVGEESDLLAGELDVHFGQDSGFTAAGFGGRWLFTGAVLLGLLVLVVRRRRGGKA